MSQREGGILLFFIFVLERMENKKSDYFLKIYKIRPLIDMDLIFFFNFHNILVVS